MSALRPYQAEALSAVLTAWQTGTHRVGVSLPTGVGKTHIMAHLGAELVASGAGWRVIYLVHRDTLVEQTVAKLRATVPASVSIGVVKAERHEVGARVIVASVHTLRTPKRRAFLADLAERGVPLALVVDEAHVSRSATYMSVFFDARALVDSSQTRMAGFTATWSRSDALGLGDVWQDIVYHKTIKWALDDGLLVRPRAVRIGVGADLAGVRTSSSGGDYREGDLERAVMLESIREAVVAGVRRHRGSRPGVLFAPTVQSAEFFGQALREDGLRVAGWYHSTSRGDRHRIDAGIRSGALDLMTTCTAVAEGYDNPSLAFGVLCRPTQHEGLFVQMVGRLLRPWPGKDGALLLDAVGATSEVKLRSAVDLSVTAEHTDGEPVEDDLDEPQDADPEPRERLVRVRADDVEVSLLAGTPVQWLTSRGGVPFVDCGKRLVFIVPGPDGWYVGQADSRLGADGRPTGRWVAQGLSQEDALTTASDHAESEGATIARRGSRWRTAKPTEAQIATATRMGIVVGDLRRGALSDRMSEIFATRVLAPFATWAEAHAYREDG